MLKHGFKTASFSSTLKFQLKQHSVRWENAELQTTSLKLIDTFQKYFPTIPIAIPLCKSF